MTEENAKPTEFKAINSVYEALEPLDDDARARVLNYIASLMEITTAAPAKARARPDVVDDPEDEGTGGLASKAGGATPNFGTMAELYDAAQPTTSADKALVASYWLQVNQGVESFDSQTAHKELKHLGHALANITNALDALKTQKPALVLQLRKSGTTQQARKTYKLTVAGIRAVEKMIEEAAGNG